MSRHSLAGLDVVSCHHFLVSARHTILGYYYSMRRKLPRASVAGALLTVARYAPAVPFSKEAVVDVEDRERDREDVSFDDEKPCTRGLAPLAMFPTTAPFTEFQKTLDTRKHHSKTLDSPRHHSKHLQQTKTPETPLRGMTDATVGVYRANCHRVGGMMRRKTT